MIRSRGPVKASKTARIMAEICGLRIHCIAILIKGHQVWSVNRHGDELPSMRERHHLKFFLLQESNLALVH